MRLRPQFIGACLLLHRRHLATARSIIYDNHHTEGPLCQEENRRVYACPGLQYIIWQLSKEEHRSEIDLQQQEDGSRLSNVSGEGSGNIQNEWSKPGHAQA